MQIRNHAVLQKRSSHEDVPNSKLLIHFSTLLVSQDIMLYSLIVATLLKASLSGAAPTASPFTFYDMPTPLSGPCDICEGHDGYVYIQNFLVDTLVRLDPATGERTEYQIPYENPPSPTSVLPGLGSRTALACAIRPGNDGKIYAASGVRNEIVVLDPATGTVDVFAQPANDPLGNLFPFNDLWPGETGVSISGAFDRVFTSTDYPIDVFFSSPRQYRLAVRLQHARLPELPPTNASERSTRHAYLNRWRSVVRRVFGT